MPKEVDLTGRRFGRWFVLNKEDAYIASSGNRYTRYLCRCDCGAERAVLSASLRNGRSTSCGCYNAENKKEVCRKNFTTHGESKTRLYHIYNDIKKRCYNKNAHNFDDYGGRGISVCAEWRFDYNKFRQWALANGYKDDLSIDRIDVDGDYSPNNCRWVDNVTQANNRRSNRIVEINEQIHTLAEWARILDVPYKRLHKQFSKGIPLLDIK